MGAAMYGGRWNSIGNFVLYTAETSSLSMLEHLAHITGADSIQYTLTEIDLKNSLIVEVSDLQINWNSNEKLSSQIGDQWVKDKNSPILKVPSVINPFENNIVINPNHPELEMEIINQEWFVYDFRLMKTSV